MRFQLSAGGVESPKRTSLLASFTVSSFLAALGLVWYFRWTLISADIGVYITADRSN